VRVNFIFSAWIWQLGVLAVESCVTSPCKSVRRNRRCHENTNARLKKNYYKNSD